MKPHPRIRKTIKWGGAAVTALLVVVWIGSGWYSFDCVDSRGRYWEAWAGETRLGVPEPGKPHLPPGVCIERTPAAPYRWWFYKNHPTFLFNDGYYIAIPLWSCALVSSLATTTAWRLDTLARRRARIGLCPKCGYDRTGLVAGGVCPECGATGSGASPEPMGALPTNRQELRLALEREGFNPDYYWLEGGLPSERYTISDDGTEWSVYYSERGLRSDRRVFASEHEACEHFLSELRTSRDPYARRTN